MNNYDIVKLAKAKESEIINIRRDLHKIPELHLELPKTVEYVCKKLDELKIPYYKLIDGNAIVAQIDGTKKGRCIAVRADMDALPITENTGLKFASEHEGCMHACGHDGHTAMALGVAMILKELSSEFEGSVKLLFQPGEEYPGGALPMIEEGAMENPKVDAVIGLHEGYIHPSIPVGKIGVIPGVFFAAADLFSLKIVGKGSHGAQPHLSVDPIPIACDIVSAFQRILTREIPPVSKAVISICQFHSGTAHNIIPEEVFIEGTVRTTDESERAFIANRMQEIATGIAKAHRAKAILDYKNGYPVLINDKGFTEFFVQNTKDLLGDDAVMEVPNPTMGGEDMAYFLQKAPGTFFLLSNPVVHKNGIIYPHHSDKFDIDESFFYIGTAAIANTVLKYLKQSNLS
ncbi:MAG: N-acyl-L-amino acid amidohydrolase [Treponema sp.]|nr:MAG: N-acyl-L-amino acid amidohydrolase [Treponema sp.]